MSTLKKCKVVMLPTEKASPLVHNNLKQGLFCVGGNGVLAKHRMGDCTNQHLYILSDEEIPYNPNGGTDGHFICLDEINQNNYHNTTLGDKQYINPYVKNVGNCKGCRKIIATTDKSLFIHQKETFTLPERVFYLPQPSQSFIEKYVEEYNKGNIISDVMVEHHPELYDGTETTANLSGRLKINPKDNTITIKKVKDSWSREEVIKLMKLSWDKSLDVKNNPRKYYYSDGKSIDNWSIDKWIQDNL